MSYEFKALSSDDWKAILKKLEAHGKVIRKFADGAEVQFKGFEDTVWRSTDFPVFTPEFKYRVKPKGPALEIPWELITGEYKFAAMDLNGRTFIYQKEPRKMNGIWGYGGAQPLPLLNLNPRNVPWDESLTPRPGGEG